MMLMNIQYMETVQNILVTSWKGRHQQIKFKLLSIKPDQSHMNQGHTTVIMTVSKGNHTPGTWWNFKKGTSVCLHGSLYATLKSF